MNVGTKELKNRLSHFLRIVRDGEVVTVSDRGVVVAQILPVHTARAATDEDVLRELERDGTITRASRRPRDFAPVRARRRGGKTISRMIIEDRG